MTSSSETSSDDGADEPVAPIVPIVPIIPEPIIVSMKEQPKIDYQECESVIPEQDENFDDLYSIHKEESYYEEEMQPKKRFDKYQKTKTPGETTFDNRLA